MSGFTVEVAPSARRDLDRLPMKVSAALYETIRRLADNPQKLGKRLHLELTGLLVARRGPYRIVYRIDDDRRQVSVVAVDHRAHVYKRVPKSRRSRQRNT